MGNVFNILRPFIQGVIRKVRKQPYPLDPDLPTSQLILIAFRRFAWSVRGIFRILLFQRRLTLVFMGPCVKIRCHSRVRLGFGVTLDQGVLVDGLSRDGVIIGDGVSIGRNSIIRCTGSLSALGVGVTIGTGSGLDSFAFIGAAGGVEIGKNVIMGQHVSLHAENHKCEDLNQLIKDQGTTRLGIIIGDNCWVGSNVTFLDGCRVGSGCVIGAGSVVRGTIAENSIVVGIPARVIRIRGQSITQVEGGKS